MKKKWTFILSLFLILSVIIVVMEPAQASDVKAHSEGGITLRIKEGGGKPTEPTDPTEPTTPTDPMTKPEGGKPSGKIPQLGDLVKSNLSIVGALLLFFILSVIYRRKKAGSNKMN